MIKLSFNYRNLLGCLSLALLFVMTGCTMHPAGETQLRRTALRAGKFFAKPYHQRQLPPLPIAATPRQLVAYALVDNTGVQQAYWKWRSAIEQIPQAGTEPTTVMLNAGTLLTNGAASLANSTIGASNMGSSDIRWPSKMSVQAKRALRNALAAGWKYQSARFALRRDVLTAWYRYVRTTLLLRLTQRQLQVVNSAVLLRQAAISTGGSTVNWLSDQNSVDTLRAGISALRAKLPQLLARLNALLGRPAGAPLIPPAALPPLHLLKLTDNQLLRLAVQRNPDLRALRELQKAGHLTIQRAKMQYIPNFDLGLSTSLDGTVQNLTGAMVMPIFQYQSINASIAQARSDLRATNVALRGKQVNLDAALTIDLTALHNDQSRQRIFSRQILPRVGMIASLARTDYQQGTTGIQGQIQAQQMELEIQGTMLDLQTDALERMADLDAIVAMPLNHLPAKKKSVVAPHK